MEQPESDTTRAAHEVVAVAHHSSDDVTSQLNKIRLMARIVAGSIVVALVVTVIVLLDVLAGFRDTQAKFAATQVQIQTAQVAGHKTLAEIQSTVNAHNVLLTGTLDVACILIEHSNPPLPIPAGCTTLTAKP